MNSVDVEKKNVTKDSENNIDYCEKYLWKEERIQRNIFTLLGI